MRHKHYDVEHFNLAGEYNKAKAEGGASMNLDEYCSLVRAVGKAAMTLDRTPDPDRTQRFTDEEVDAMLLGLEPCP